MYTLVDARAGSAAGGGGGGRGWCRGRRGHVQDGRRPAEHQDWSLAAQVRDRRVAAADERAQGRDEPGGPAAAAFLDDVERYDDVATRLLLAKPGMTGLWASLWPLGPGLGAGGRTGLRGGLVIGQ